MDKIGRILRYLHDPEPRNDSNRPIVCLSQVYCDDSASETLVGTARPWPRDFVLDQGSLFCFTYRTGFPKIPRDSSQQPSPATWFGHGDGFTTDVGFGCMIRSTQTLLANVLSTLRLGRDWRRGPQIIEEARIMQLFADDPEAPFSIHRFITHGAQACGKPAGQWFGPNAASLCINSLATRFPQCGLKVYLASEQGGTIYEDSVLEIARSAAGFSPLLILVPQRLGHERINPKYYPSLGALFEMPQFMGIAGGRPSSAHYFFAKQEDNLFFLDPHTDRPSIPYHEDPSRYESTDLQEVHTQRIRRMPMKDLDPSMLIGFLVRDEDDWQAWKSSMTEQQGAFRVAAIAPMQPSYLRTPDVSEDQQPDDFLDEDGLQ